MKSNSFRLSNKLHISASNSPVCGQHRIHANFPQADAQRDGMAALQELKQVYPKLPFNMKRAQHLLLALLICLNVPVPGAQAAEPGKPNVLLLIVDDLNTWMLNKPGRFSGKVMAPNIKRLAESGIQFSNAFAASPKCSPSRTAFLMGVAPWQSGHTDNGLKISDNPVLAKAMSFTKLFQDQGYFMATSGKISHGFKDGVNWDQTWRHKRDPAPPGTPFNGFAMTPSGKLTERDWGVSHLKESEMNDTKVADSAIKALKMNHDRPFFIACGLFHPHMPWYGPQKYFDLYPLEEIEVPPVKDDDLDDIPQPGRMLISDTYDKALEHKEYRKGVQAYLATTTYADTQMGRVLDTLENSPYRDNTIVILISDHGFHVGEKHHWQKGTMWEEGANSLMMFRVPGLTQPKQICERPVSLMDLYPTIVELAGIEKPEHVYGNSLVPLLQDASAPHDHPVFTAYQDHISIRTDRYRLIQYSDGSNELYDLNMDPHQYVNQAQHPSNSKIVANLSKQLPEFKMLDYVRRNRAR